MAKLKNIFKSKQVIFYVLAGVMLILAIWFIFLNSIFLVKNLNKAFNIESVQPQQTIKFDREGFEKLNLLTER